VVKAFRDCTLLTFRPVPTHGSHTGSETRETRPRRDSAVAGEMYPYPSSAYIEPVRNPILCLAMCLVQEGHVTAEEMVGMMGCSAENGEGKKKKDRKGTKKSKKKRIRREQ